MYHLTIKNPNEPNWEFSDDFEDFDNLVELVASTIVNHKEQIIETNIYNLKPFEIKIFKLEDTTHEK